MSAATTADETLSAECTLARRPGYKNVHRMCNQTRDVPLPYSNGAVLLTRRCTCTCHRRGGAQ